MTFNTPRVMPGQRLRMLCLFVCTLFAIPAAASYLDELEKEAGRSFDTPPPSSRTPASPQTPPTTRETGSPAVADSEESIQPGLDKGQFESELMRSFYGSYLFYSTLGDREQEVVYREYTRNNNIEHLREIIKAQMK